jgi:Tol biopolymer transport system component
MKNLIFFLAFFTILNISCDKQDSTGPSGENRLWPPALSGIRGDSSVELKWMNPIIFNKMLKPFDYVVPERFEIYMSEGDSQNLAKIATVENDGLYTYTVSNLKNGLNYFFEVKSIRKGMEPEMSGLIMIMPSEPEEIRRITENKDYPMESGSFSMGNGIMAYVNRSFTWDNGMFGQAALFSFETATGENRIIDTASYFPDWSPTEMKLVYCTDKHEVLTGNKMPQHLVIYDYETGIRKKLTTGTSFNINPEFSHDGNWIAYSSDDGKDGVFNLWRISSDGSQKIRITNNLNLSASSMGNVELGRPVWSPDDRYLYYNIASGESSTDGISRVNIQTGQTEAIIKSAWFDTCPSLSPDGKKIAFISDRSGSNQIWLYDLNSGLWKQITGCNGDYVNRDWGKLEWTGNGEILFSGYSYADSKETLLTVKIKE